ncbi:MAG: DUF1700 domain-containing protein [Peptostreptococcaceae bacterium]|nr:DUF1700 domain-containing protein [Peptostreptococcaceae bacterium]
MNKSEFLEILKDYLGKDFSEYEVNDILRDYEEYFVDGIIEGKSDMEIISALGSPKSIAKDLVSQMKEKDENKQFKNSKFTDNISDKYEQSKIKARDIFRKGKNYVSEKLTPNLYSESSRLSTKLIKIILKILSLVLLMPAFMFIVVMIPIGISLIMSLVAFIVAIPLVVNFVWSVPEITAVVIFASILFIGCEIIAWHIFIFFIRLFIKLSKRYMNWIKTRNIYINASEKKDRLEKDSYEEDGKGDDDYE